MRWRISKRRGALASLRAGDSLELEKQNCYPAEGHAYEPVSYTHLDVYKRQIDMSTNAVKVVLPEDTSLTAFYRDMSDPERRTFWACATGWALDGRCV